MICPHVTARFGIYIGINTCARCGESDDPESASFWALDDDNDRICPTCIEKGEPLSTLNPVLDPIRELSSAKMAFASVRRVLRASLTREESLMAEAIRKAVLARLGRAEARMKFHREKEI